MANCIIYNYSTNTFDQIEAVDPAAGLFALIKWADLHFDPKPKHLDNPRIQWHQIRAISMTEYKPNMWNVALEATDPDGNLHHYRAAVDTI